MHLGGEIRERLEEDCARHRRTVEAAVAARRRDELEPALVARICAREVHSAKGVAGVLGLSEILAIIGELCDELGHGEPPSAQSFYDDLEGWFVSLLACSISLLDGELDEVAVEALTLERERLSSLLSPQPEAAPDELPLSLAPSAGRRLLFVDVSAAVRFSVAALLNDRGYPVETAGDLGDVSRLLAQFDPELVVTDLAMPGVEGDELCRRIKERMKRLVPVIVYSGLPASELERRAEAAGADGHVSKEAGIAGLIRRMDELLSEEILS